MKKIKKSNCSWTTKKLKKRT